MGDGERQERGHEGVNLRKLDTGKEAEPNR